jgi:hypothetical protein
MAIKTPFDSQQLTGLIALPIELTVETMNALEDCGAIMAAISYATKYLSESLRRREQFAIFECANVTLIATLVEYEDGWQIFLEPCTPKTFMREKLEGVCTHF